MRRLLVPLAALVLLGILATWWFSPTQVVKRRVLSMLDTAEVPATMSDLARNTRGPNLAGYLAPRVSFRPPESLADEIGSTYTRDQITALYSAVARACQRISIDDIEAPLVQVWGDTAMVGVSLDAVVEVAGRRPADGIQHIEMRWTKTDEGWLMYSIGWKETGR